MSVCWNQTCRKGGVWHGDKFNFQFKTCENMPPFGKKFSFLGWNNFSFQNPRAWIVLKDCDESKTFQDYQNKMFGITWLNFFSFLGGRGGIFWFMNNFCDCKFLLQFRTGNFSNISKILRGQENSFLPHSPPPHISDWFIHENGSVLKCMVSPYLDNMKWSHRTEWHSEVLNEMSLSRSCGKQCSKLFQMMSMQQRTAQRA